MTTQQTRSARTWRKHALIATLAWLSALAFPSAWALTQVTSFGSNPGNLQMFKHVPSGMPSNAPLVVALHGCSQSAADYEKSGWTALANKHKFYVVYPQQQSGNNMNKCFNWFESGDMARGSGEALSVKQMVDKMRADHSIDANRVFVTGLSAGAAFTNVMLAAYPDVFAGGAPIAGIPYKCASSATAGFSCMSPGVNKTATQWGDLARSGYSGYTGRKPRVSIWQGSSDNSVKPMNMTETMEQWTNFNGVDQTADTSDTVKGYPRKVYKDGSGNVKVETYSITGMAHGTPVDPGTGTDQCGTAASYFLDMNICSSYFIGQFFGIIGAGTTTTTSSGTTSTAASTTTTTAGACYTASNYSHVSGGRAYTNISGYTYANGSNQNMGLYNVFVTTKLRKTGTNYYIIDNTCP